MYEKICKYCNINIMVKNRYAFAAHVTNCNMNPVKILRQYENEKRRSLNIKIEKIERLSITRNCIKCNKEFNVRGTEKELNNKKSKKCCSIKCANSKSHSEQTKEKIGYSIKNSEKHKIASKNHSKKILENRIKRKCLVCDEIMILRPKDPKKYHIECFKKIAGGMRHNSLKQCKCGWYKGYWCDSSWELAFVIYNLDHSIKFERNTKGFEYEYENKTYKYYPDFILEDGTYIEIKGYKSKNSDAKIKAFPFKITVLYKNEIKKYLDYAKNKYGNKFIEVYENKEVI